jgi:hypothetical protein
MLRFIMPLCPAPSVFPLWRSFAILILGAGTIAACLLTQRPHAASAAGVVMQLPYRVDNFWGFDQAVSHAERTILPPDTEFVRKNYESSSGDSILCSIVLSGVEKRSIHRPEICLPGQGWTIQSSEITEVPLQSGKTLKVTNLFLTRPVDTGSGKKQTLSAYYMYWFVGQNIVTPYHWERIWRTSWDSVVHHINHRWAYVIVSSPIAASLDSHGKNRPQTLEMMKTFIRDILPSFQKVEP